MAAQPLTHGQLIGRQRAEFDRAAKLQLRIFKIQVAITVVGAGAVFLDSQNYSYVLALIALLLAAGWAYVAWQYRGSRGQAERARRATLLMEGLGQEISQSELRALWCDFSAGSAEAASLEDAHYYDAREKVGPPRLLEMLEETSFWSCRLMKGSARRMWFAFTVSTTIGLLLFMTSVMVIDGRGLQDAARLLCVLLTMTISAEVIGAALSYESASAELGKMGARIEVVRASGHPMADMLMLLCDYNSIVEGAPLFWPGLYAKESEHLNALWQQRKL
jgi:hypothetical protein